MRRGALSWLKRTGSLAGLALLLASCGTAGSSRSSSHAGSGVPASARLSVTPLVGHPTTVFAVRFSPPASARQVGGQRLGYELSVSGPAQVGCVAASSLSLAKASAGLPLTTRLAPARLGGRWCTGTYALRVSAVSTPICAAGTMCPQFIRVIGVVARASFRVT